VEWVALAAELPELFAAILLCNLLTSCTFRGVDEALLTCVFAQLNGEFLGSGVPFIAA
jgi:hypothetical protein